MDRAIHYINIFLKKKFNNWIKCISKKITTTGSSAFQKNLQRLDQLTLVIFSPFLKKITRTGSSHFLSPDGQGYYFLPHGRQFETGFLVRWRLLIITKLWPENRLQMEKFESFHSTLSIAWEITVSQRTNF